MSKTEDTEKPAKTTNTRGTKVRRRRRIDPNDVKMHLRIPRDLHAECIADADRLGTSINAVVIDRVAASSSRNTKLELSQLVTEISNYGKPVLQLALEAMWSTDETHRMRCILNALHAARDAAV